jgi:hypothetical protein
VLKNLCDIRGAANKGKAVNRRKTILKGVKQMKHEPGS